MPVKPKTWPDDPEAYPRFGPAYVPTEEGMPLYNWNLLTDPVYADDNGPGISRTRQEFAEECDVNVLMRKYDNSWPPPPNGYVPQYLDVTEVPDLMTAQAFLIDAQEAFMRLPARVRREFDNDPVQFVDFATDPENLDQMRLWGLAAPKEAAEASPRAGEPPAPPVGDPSSGGA